MKGNKIWFLAAAVLYALILAVNLGGAWMGDPADWENGAATAVYLLLWAVFTAKASPKSLRLARVVAVLTLVGAVLGLMARAQNWLFTIPALLLTPLTAVPMYGLRLVCSWNMTYAVTALLAGMWLLCLGWYQKSR